MKRNGLACLAFVWGFLSASAQNITNGSFETGNLNGWSASGGSMTVTAGYASAEQVDGTYCLQVGNGNNATLQSSDNTRQRPVNLVSFTAKTTGGNNAELYLTVNGTDYTEVRYVIRPHWCTYYLPFRSDGNVRLTFRFASDETFLLDNIRIDDQNTTDIDVESTYLWNSRFGEDWGWVDGDNDISIELPNGFQLWFFNDSFYGSHNDKTNVFTGGRFLRNAMLVYHPLGYLFSKYTGETDTTTRYFECADASPQLGVDNLYWLGDAVFTDDSKVKVVLVEVLAASEGTVATGRTYLATFDYPFDYQNIPYPTIERRIDEADGYETVVYDEDYAYIYRGDTQMWDQSTHVARCAKNDMTGSKGTWQFYTGSGWSGDRSQSRKVCNYDPSAVIKLQPGNYAMVYMPILSREVRVSFAQSPVGPWTASQLVYTRPNDEQYWSYMPNIHQKLDNGKYSVSYSVNCWEDWGAAFNDKFFYRQRYIQVDLLGLSPYTRTDLVATCYPNGFFQGAGYGLPAGSYTTLQMRQWGILPDCISSIDLQPGYQATFYKGDNFTGESETITSGTWYVGEDFNDAVRSIRIEAVGGDWVRETAGQKASLTVCPNPADAEITIGSPVNQEALLTDMSGRVIAGYQLKAGDNTVGIGHLPKGNYLIRTTSDNVKFTKR
ncbi:MAG: T9SS type A sorting domain-containing protein [Paludibacteraceae bacterium]|nr:T9SS type A sorting domain-containing protein [Paludibacteraceae bacterium]